MRRIGSMAGAVAWAVGLLVLLPVAYSQEASRPRSRATTQPARAPETRNASSRPATELEVAIADLRKAQTVAAATICARNTYGLGDEARRALIDLCREKTLPDATFQGIVGQFEFERDPAILPVLFDLYGAGEAGRDRYLTERFRAFDAQRSMFEDLFSSIEKERSPARRRTLLRVLAEIVDTPPERMQAARFLVVAFQRAEFRDYTDDVKSTLRRITFHDFALPALWQKWFESFAAANPEGFAEADLYWSALRESNQRFIAEVKRSITVAIANKQIPQEYFDPVRYPEPIIRAHAALEFGALKDADPNTVRQAATVLEDALKTERDEDVMCALLRSLGSVVENRDDLKQSVGPSLVPLLRDERDTVVVAALKALAQTGTGSDCHVIEDLYSQAAMSKRDRSGVRAQVVTTLYSLDCGSPVIVNALEDAAAEVRASAARGLGYGKQTTAASKIAKALSVEKTEETQRVMARSLVALQVYPPDVVDTLLDVADRPGAARDAAVRGLIQAASTGNVAGDQAERLVTLLSEALPLIAATPDKRKVLIDDFQGAKGPLAARILGKWLEVEGQNETARDLAAILARILPQDPEVLASHAGILMSHRRGAAAVTLLRAAVDLTGPAGTTTSRSVRQPELRIELARALLLEKTAEGLGEAEGIASQELRLKPEDGQLLMLRGSIREALGRRFEAAEDLRRALKTEGVVMADPQRQDAERRTALLLLSEDPKKAREFLDGLPTVPRDRDFLIVMGRVDLATDDVRQAILHLRAALKATGRDGTGVVRYYLAQALLRSARADDLLEARTLFEVLENEPLPDGYALQPLREQLRQQAATRAAVRDLDEVSQEGVSSSMATVISLGDKALPWLLHQFSDFAKTAPLSAVERRVTALGAIFAADPVGAKAFASLAPPEPGAPREAWLDFAARLTDWCERRR